MRPRVVGAVIAALAGVVGLAGLPSGAVGRSGPGKTVTETRLPTTAWFGTVAQIGDRLVLEGETPTSVPDQQGACVTARLDPATLRVGVEQSNPLCGAIFGPGQDIGYETTSFDHNNLVELSLVTANPNSGQLTVGPNLMTYDECAGGNPESAYGGGWLWIYEAACQGPTRVWQISASTGQVVDSISDGLVLAQPVVAANAEGFWFGPSVEGGWSGPQPTTSLYRIAPGASAPVAVTSGFRDLCWMIGQGTSLWVASGPAGGGCGPQRVARYEGSDPTPRYSTADPYATLTMLGGRGGLWTIVASSRNDESASLVVSIDPVTGRAAVVARVSRLYLQDRSLAPGEAAAYRGSLYVLGLPDVGEGGFARLFRITPG